MKTIKEAAIEYRNIEIFDGNDKDSMFTSRLGMKMIYERVFNAGVEFAQRWIPVTEELPQIGKVVLLKFDDDYTQITTGFLKDGSFVDDFGFDDEICTHWRPIERL